MKTVLVTLAILSSSILSQSFAKGGLNLNEELKKVVKFENSTLSINKNQPAFVKVSFKIDNSGKIEILEMNYSNETIKSILLEKLAQLEIKTEHNPEHIYNYNFIFKKG